MGCKNCGSKVPQVRNLVQSSMDNVEGQFVKIEYLQDDFGRANSATHRVVGSSGFTKEFPNIRMIRRSGAYFIDYGKRKCGDVFYVHKQDQKMRPDSFKIIETKIEIVEAPRPKIEPVKPPQKSLRSAEIKELSDDIIEQMYKDGIVSINDLVKLGEEGLTKYKGIGTGKAKNIMLQLGQQ